MQLIWYILYLQLWTAEALNPRTLCSPGYNLPLCSLLFHKHRDHARWFSLHSF